MKLKRCPCMLLTFLMGFRCFSAPAAAFDSSEQMIEISERRATGKFG